eukprot:TRINITY_DN79363_c0_g1_i1.p1 TRINITY_DN79363_c0_g1~~TRINITY_DN79363_c0_g1_i1.p1  ORF type:complete len:846 (-),score=135.71 TRINITY_DN79363_c0_g1_i1:99-2507(-)
MATAKDMLCQMLLDDGSPERGHRANLLNPDFHFVGIACGRHPSAETAVVLLFADQFKAKQKRTSQLMLGVTEGLMSQASPWQEEKDNEEVAAQKAWDHLMQSMKPKHLSVPAGLLGQVQTANAPKIYRYKAEKIPHFCVGTLLPKVAVDPAIVRAFLHRIDTNKDDKAEEVELAGVCHKYQLDVSWEDVLKLIDEIVDRRPPGTCTKRAVAWTEVFAACRFHKRWEPAVDILVVQGGDKHHLTMETEVLNRWCQEVYGEYAPICDKLAPPPRPATSGGTASQSALQLTLKLDKDQTQQEKPLPRNSSAEVRVKELNDFLQSVLEATVTTTGLPLQSEKKVQKLLSRPDGLGAGRTFSSAVIMGKRNLWAYQSRPNREVWLKLMRAVGLNPDLKLRHPLGSEVEVKPVKEHIQDDVKKVQSLNVARPKGGEGAPTNRQPKVAVRQIPQKVEVEQGRAQHIIGVACHAGTHWEDKRQNTDTIVNRCIKADSSASDQITSLLDTVDPQLDQTNISGTTGLAYTFEARRQFQQVLAKQERASDERRFLGAERAGSTVGGSAGTRGYGNSSLANPSGVRGHFHTSVGVASATGSHGWPQSLDVRWDGSHIDHARGDELRPNPKYSILSAEEKERQFSTYFRMGREVHDCNQMKVRNAVDTKPDVETYKDWSAFEHREEIPQRHGKFGRRAFDPQVGDKAVPNPYNISELDNKPSEEFRRQQERVQEYLHRSLPPGQARHFKQYQPQAEQPGKMQEMWNRERVGFVCDGGQKKTTLGYGQERHSDDKDYKLYSRPLGISQMDRGLPMA